VVRPLVGGAKNKKYGPITPQYIFVLITSIQLLILLLSEIMPEYITKDRFLQSAFLLTAYIIISITFDLYVDDAMSVSIELLRKINVFLNKFFYLIGMYKKNIQGKRIIEIPSDSVSQYYDDEQVYSNQISLETKLHMLDELESLTTTQDNDYYLCLPTRDAIIRSQYNINDMIQALEFDLYSLNHREKDIKVSKINYIDNDNVSTFVDADINANQVGYIRPTEPLDQMRYDAKNMLKNILNFCLFFNPIHTGTGGRTKSRTNKRKTNNKNKKRIARTKKSKRNSRSV
jgi:hypothetical protein